jgi:thiol-disulfide isomerase/thioredoxin
MRTLLRLAAALITLLLTTTTYADRLDDFNKLEAEYKAAEEKFFNAARAEEPSAQDNIRNYEAWPGWQYLPRFLAIAEAEPSDEAAYRACMWIFDRTGNVGNDDLHMFDAEQQAWRIIAAHHAKGNKVPELCLEAVQRFGPAQEEFLRGILKQKDLPREHVGFATMALGESLAHKFQYLESFQAGGDPTSDNEFAAFLKKRRSPDWGKDLSPANAARFKTESAELLRTVLREYSEVPNTISMPYFRRITKLGEKAQKSLHALEQLSIGAEAPDIVGKDLDGKPLNLRDYRGRVVLLSFWFSGCGPCIGMVPKERELVEKFKGRPFALLAICADADLEDGRAAAKENGMDWPCWFDNENGPIAQNYNILSWPTFYLLDKEGRIAAKVLDREHMDIPIEKLLNDKPQ